MERKAAETVKANEKLNESHIVTALFATVIIGERRPKGLGSPADLQRTHYTPADSSTVPLPRSTRFQGHNHN